MENQKRILYLGNHAGYFISHRLPIFSALQQAGYEVHVAAPSRADHIEKLITGNIDAPKRIEDLGFHFHKIVLNRGSMNPMIEFRSILSVFQVYQKVKPDLVFHATIKPVIFGGIVSRITRVPSTVNLISGLGYVFIQSGVRGSILRYLAKLAYGLAINRPNTFTIFQNPDDYQVFLDHKIVSIKNSSVIKGSGVNMDEFVFEPEPPEPPVTVLISRMLWDKGIGEFVKAAKILRKENIDGRFVLVGDSDKVNPNSISQQQLRRWHDDGTIEWLGWKQNIPDILRQSHIVCLPSYREGIPKSLIEAAACGRAIVTTDVPGCREIVHHADNGFLVAPRDVQALADALRILIKNPELRQEMGNRSREIAEADFSAQTIGKQVTEICMTLLRNSWIQNRN